MTTHLHHSGIACAADLVTTIPIPLRGDLCERQSASTITETLLSETSQAILGQVNQRQSAVDKLCNSPLERIPAHRDHTIIVSVFTRNTHAQIKMGLPPVTPLRNLLIIEQSLKAGPFDQVSVASCQVETIVRKLTAIVSNNIGTAANSQQDIMIKSAETA